MYSVQRLRLLFELERLGTIAAVAEALSYSPSAVSQQLAALERETGVVLLERVGRGVKLTDAARVLVGHTATILRAMELAKAAVAATHERVTGTLRVASFQTVVVTLAPAALQRLGQEHPDLAVHIRHREAVEAYEDLLRHDVDVILDEDYPDAPVAPRSGVEREELLSDPLYLLLPPQGRYADARSLADLADAPWALDEPDSVMGAWSRRVCRHAGFEPRSIVDTPDPLLHLHLARAGLAVTFTPGLIAGSQADPRRLRRVPGDPRRRLFTVVRDGSAAHPAIRSFRSALAHSAALVAPDDETIPFLPAL